MSQFLRDYLTVVWFGAAALLIGGLLLGIAALIRPSNPNYDKSVAYESGVDPVGIGQQRERQAQFGSVGRMALGRRRIDAERPNAVIGVGLDLIAHGGELAVSAGCVIAGIEDQQHPRLPQ